MATRLHQTYFVGVSGTLHVYLTKHVFEYFKSSREKPLICTFTFIDPRKEISNVLTNQEEARTLH